MPVQRFSARPASPEGTFSWTSLNSQPDLSGSISAVTRVTAPGRFASQSVKTRRRGRTISRYSPACSTPAPSLPSAKENEPPTRASIFTRDMGREAVANSHLPARFGSSHASKTRPAGMLKRCVTRTSTSGSVLIKRRDEYDGDS
jgi:hypothetical protein